jgi:hypothetical protein
MLGIIEIVERHGASFAFPTQTLHVASMPVASMPVAPSRPLDR